MATMDDIAKRLNISKGTVSKALSGAEDVSEAMRRMVLETAVEIGYTRISRTRNRPKVCVFIENMAYEKPEDFGWELVLGFRKMAEPEGFAVDVVPFSAAMQKEYPYDEYMLKNHYEGGLFLGVNFMDPWMQDFKTCRTPTVLLDNRSQYNPWVTQVGLDNDAAMEMAVAKLKELGHTTIGYLSAALGAQVFQDRYLAFFRALRKHGLRDDRVLGGHAYHASECLEHHLPRLLEMGCTAIVCSHDLLASPLLIHCSEKRIRVPQQLSIIGVDDLPLCSYTTPALTSIRQDRNKLGKSAFYALSSQINQVHISSLKLHPELILRDSVGRAPDRL